MSVLLNPYLSFKDNTRQAMEFYKTVFGGTLDLNTFEASHMPVGPDEGEMIMHAQLKADNGVTFMAADTPPSHGVYQAGTNISMSLSGDDETVLRGYFEKLSADGKVNYPLEKAPWGDTFGMLTDQFGINWMVNITAQK